MFEQGLAYLLKKFLGSFVEDGDAIKEKVQVGVWSGLIVLENLRLKSSLLSLVDIPISLSYGYIGRLELRIPWGNLGVDPVMVIIDKIYVVIEPKYEWNPGAADRREQAIKQAKLAAAELFANKRLAANNTATTQTYSDYAKSWLMTSFINKIIDNIQITIREVHVRYEDQQSCQSNFCVGVTLESLHVQSRDNSFSFEENYSPKKDIPRSAFAQDDATIQPELKTHGYETFHKLIQVNHLSMYWNPLVPSGLNASSCIFKGRSSVEIQNLMYRTIPTRVHQITDRPRHHYILLPIDINNYLDMSFNASTGVAKANVKLVITELALCLEDLQIREIISLAINMGSFAKLQRFSEFRPTSSIHDQPAAWWRYAINAVLLQIRIDNKKTLNLKHISQRHRDKLVYTELWKSKLMSSASVINQLAKASETFTKPSKLDRENSRIYQLIYNRAKATAEAATIKENIQKGSTYKPSKQSKYTASLNNNKILAVTEHKNSKTIPVATHLISQTPYIGTSTQPLNKETIDLLLTLEYLLDFEDIVMFRSLAERNLSVETTTQSWLGGWVSWMGTGGSGGGVSEEEKRKLFEALKYDPDRVLRGGLKEVNQNEVMAIVSVQVHQASITLALTSPERSSAFQTSIPFLKLELEDMRNRSVIMGDGAHVSVSVSLQDFAAYEVLPTTSTLSALKNDGPRNKILFRRELRGSNTNTADWGTGSISSKYMDASVASMRSSMRHRSEEIRPLFSTVIEILPPNKDTDMTVNLSVEEVEIWVSPTAKWTSAMATFVAWPADQQYWSEMEMSAVNQFADFKARFDAKIEYMMQNHQNIIIEARVKAPVVVISDQASKVDSGDVLVIDLGLITLSTEKLAKAQRQKLIDARSHTGFTSDATNTTPVHGGRAGMYEREKPRRGRGDVAVNLFSERKQLPSVREPPGWEVLADDEGDADAEDARSPCPDPMSTADQEQSAARVGAEHSSAPVRRTPSPKGLAPSGSASSGLCAMDLASMTSYDLEEKSADDMANNYMAGSYGGGGPAAMSVVSSVHTGGFEFGQDDETLFDVFQCQISQIEIYLISSAVLSDPLAGDLDISKTVIMDKFEIGIEIHASVLPWDITIPPVKLILDIPEINVKLSEQKLVRLKQFSMELITDDSQAMLTSNLARINQLNAMLKQRRNSDIGNQSRSRALSSRLSLMSNQSSMINIRSKNRRSMSLGETSSVNDLAYFDAVTGRHSMRSNPLHGESGSTAAASTSRRSLLRTESKRSRSRAGSSSFKDALETESLPVTERLKKLVNDSYVVGSDDGTGGTQFSAEEEEEGIPVEADDDDDSFFSVNENINSEEHAKQKEHLQFVIAQRESIRAKLMSDIRTSEADPSKAALHATLKKELHNCEQELQQLRVALVELLMSTEDLDLYTAEEDPGAVQRFHDGLLLPIRSADAWDKLPQQAYKRDLTQASVFKVPPTRVKQKLKDTNNRELVYLRANISVVYVDLECTPDAKLVRNIIGISNEKPKKPTRQTRRAEQQQGPLPVVTCRLKLLGISAKLRHRSQDSKVGFALRELDIEDFIQASVPGVAVPDTSKQTARHRASLFLVSSDPTNFGLHALPMVSRYNSRGSTDLLKLKYEVLFGADTLDERGDEMEEGAGQDTHNIKLSMGMVGVNIEQSRIALLMLTVHRVLQSSGVLPSTATSPLPVPTTHSLSPVRDDSSAAEAKPHLPSLVIPSASESHSRALLPNVIFSVKVDCISVSLLAKAEPLIAMHMWALSCSVQSRCHIATVSVRLADLSAFCMKRIDQHGSPHAISGIQRKSAGKMDFDPTDVQKITLFGRDPSSMQPFFSTSVHFERDPEQTLVPLVIASLKTVPIIVCLDLQCGLDVTKEIMQGAILETAAVFAVSPTDVPQQHPSTEVRSDHAPRSLQPIGAALDQIFNPLLDACNGRFEVVTGAVTIVLPADSNVSDRRASSISSWQDLPITDTTELNEVRLHLRTVEANIIWGDICEFGAMQGTLAIQGVKISCNEYDFMDPVDVFCKSCVLPNGFFVNPNPSEMVANLTFNTSFPPPEQAEIDRNMCQFAVGVSPVLVHVHEGLLRGMTVWTDNILPYVKRIQELVAPEQGLADPCVVQLLPVPHRQSSSSESLLFGETSAASMQRKSPIDIDCAVTACLLLYEVVVSVEVAAGTTFHKAGDSLAQSINTGQRRAASSKRASAGMNKNARTGTDTTTAGHRDSVAYLPVFRLVVRKIGSEVSVRPRPRDDFAFSAQGHLPGPHEAFSTLSATCGVDTVDLEHIKFSGTSYKRLLSTGIAFDHATEGTSRTQSQQCMTTSSSISGCIEQDMFNIALVDDTDDQLTFRFLRVDSVIRDDQTAQVDVHIENVHATLIADAVLALIAVGDVYTAAMSPQQSSNQRLKPAVRSGIAGAAARERAGEDGSTYNSFHFAHPSSVPMAPAACVTETTAAVQLGSASSLPVTLLTMRSFGLDELVRSVAFTVTLSSCFVYIPSERRNGARPAVCASINVEVESRTYDIGQGVWDNLLRSAAETETSTALSPSTEEKNNSCPDHSKLEDSSCPVVFTSLRVVLNSMEVFLVKSLPASICNPVAPLDVAAVLQPSVDSNSPENTRTARFPPSPLREASTPPRTYAPNTPLSTRTSTTSLGERSSTKDRVGKFQSKSLIFPFGAQLLYTAAVGVQLTPDTDSEKQQHRTGSDLHSTGSLRLLDSAGLSITQRLSVDVDTDLEVQAFLDVRPFVRIYETSIKPIVEAVDSSSRATVSPPASPATTANPSSVPFQRGREGSGAREVRHYTAETAEAKPTVHVKDGGQVLQAGTLGELFGALVGVSSLQATVNVPTLIVYVINDIYSQPVSIARLNATGINLSADVHMPVRDSKILLLRDVCMDSLLDETVEEFPLQDSSRDGQRQQGSEQPVQSSNSIVRRMQSLARSNSILSPEGMRSVRSALGLVPSQRTDAHAHNASLSSQKDQALGSPWISVNVRATIGVEYYNQRLIAREPLVEPFPLHVQFTMAQPAITHQPLLMLVNQRVQDGDRVFSADDHLFADYLTKYISKCNPTEAPDRSSRFAQQTAVNAEAPMNVQVDIPEAITVNLTMALAEIVLVTVQTLGNITAALESITEHHHASSPSGASSLETNVDISMLGIRNDSGLPLRYWAREGAPPHEVAPNTEVPMQVEYSPDQRLGGFAFDNALDGRYTTVRSVNLALFDATHNTWPELHDVPLEGNSTRLFDVDFKKQRLHSADSGRSRAGSAHSAMTPSLALELVSRGGNKILIVRSTIRVFNATKVTFRVELVSGFRNHNRNVLWEAIVPPNQGVPVPANLCNIPNGRFIVKPLIHLSTRSCEGTFWPVLLPETMSTQDFAAEVPIPKVPGISARAGNHRGADAVAEEGTVSPTADTTGDANATAEDTIDPTSPASNEVQWRRSLMQQRGTPNVQTYAHWLNLTPASTGVNSTTSASKRPFTALDTDVCAALKVSATATHCNLNVSSRGIPQPRQANVSSRALDSCMLRTLTFSAPVTVVNLTAGAIEVAITPDLAKLGQTNHLETLCKQDRGVGDLIPQTSLAPGESWDFLSAHAYSDISLSLKFTSAVSPHNVSQGVATATTDVWSEALLITGCRSKSADTTTYSIDVPYLNGSRLTVQVEVMDTCGTRVVNVFVPYWVVSNSFLPLQYQHDTWYATAADRHANGDDHLAADQSYSLISNRSDKRNSLNGAKLSLSSKDRVRHSGLGRARGLDGVVLGPELPTRGLVDVLAPAPGLSGLLGRPAFHSKPPDLNHHNPVSSMQDSSALHSALRRLTRSPSMADEVLDIASSGLGASAVTPWSAAGAAGVLSDPAGGTDGAGGKKKPYSIMQCGFSLKEKRTARLRLRTGATSKWSSYFSLDNPGVSTLEVASAPRDPSAEDADIARVMPHMGTARSGAGGRIFSFGMQISNAEPPFNRTQVVVLVDRYVMINAVGHPIEVRQLGHDSIFSLRTEEEVPLWWGAGTQVLHMRLARYGWSWSGKFPVSGEGEFSIRLRNDFDNTVFFVLVEVLMKGPYMYVIFKGGEKFSPYRFENHTLHTFKIKQKGQTPCTVLLPYHSSAYAWDEPLMPHFVCIEMLKNSLQSQDEWGAVGTFSFAALGPLELSASVRNGVMRDLVLKVVAQGPTRVLQIFDERSLRSVEKHPFSLLSPGALVGRSVIPTTGSSLCRTAKLLHITVNVASIGVSLVDHAPQELIFIAVSGISIQHSLHPQESITQLDVRRLQVDNQLWSTPYPSLLYPLLSQEKFISLMVHRDSQYTGMEFIPLLKFSIAPFDVNLDGTIIVSLHEAASHVIELLESTYTATHSRAYAQHHISLPTAANSRSGRPRSPMAAASNRSRSSSPIPATKIANEAAALSYHDTVDFVMHSPFAHSSRGERLRPSLIDSIHCIQHSLASQELQQRQKLLQFNLPDRAVQVGKTTGSARKAPPHAGLRPPVSHATVKQGPEQLLPTKEQNRATMAHFYVRKMLDSLATPSGYANPTAKVYLQRLELSEVRLNASFNPVVTKDSGETTLNDVSLMRAALNSMVWAIGSTFAKIENCPIRFNRYEVDHVFASGSNLGMMLAQNYGLQAVSQVHIVFFSLAALGNPARLIYNLGEGLWDFLYLPTKGLFVSPSAFVGGAVQGTTSLVRTVVSSVLSTAGSLASSVQVGMIALGVVDRYPAGPAEHRALAVLDNAQSVQRDRRDSIESLIEEEAETEARSGSATRTRLLAATQTVQELRPQTLFAGLQLGIAGVVYDPLTGFRVDGVKGLVIGIAKGSFGLLGRPLYGALGFASEKFDQVSFYFQPRFLANQKLRLQRVRSPRFFRSPNQPLRVYSSDENMGQELLGRVHQGQYRREGYLWHSMLKDNSVLLLTKVRVLLCTGLNSDEILWNCPLRKMRSLEVEYESPVQDTATTAATVFADRAGRLNSSFGVNSLDLTRDSAPPVTALQQTSTTAAAPPLSAMSSLVSFDCPLQGHPVLNIYHEPLQSQQLLTSPSRSSTRRMSSGRKEKETGFRLAHKILCLTSHRQLLELLGALLRLLPALGSADVLKYLEDAGINVAEVLRLQQQLQHQQGGIFKQRIHRA